MPRKSKIIGDAPCPGCRARGRDSTGNHLILFDDGGGYCNRCGYSEKSMEESVPSTKRPLDTMAEFEEAKGYPILSLATRGIEEDVALFYGVRSSFDKETGEVDAYYYPVTINGELVAYKKRKLPKDFHNIGKPLKKVAVDFTGQDVCPTQGRKLVITEGQDDMLAAFQMLWKKETKYKPSVVSVPSGSNLSAFNDNQKFLSNFSEIILCPDADEAGEKWVKDVSALLDNVKVMKLSENDANDMLLAGKKNEFVRAFWGASEYTPEGFVSVEDVMEEATRMPEWGRPWPWPSLTALTYGRRNGEGAYFGAGVKIGKSEAVNQLTQHIIVEEKRPVALFKLEEKPSMTVRRVAGKVMHKQFHVPDGDFTKEELVEGVGSIKDMLHMYDSYRSTSWEELKLAIRHAVLVKGCQDVFIDPLTRLTAGMDPTETNTELEKVADELSSMAKDLGFFYYVFCHLKAPQSGKPHEEGGKVHSNQFTGSRAMMRACYYFIGIERDKSPDLPEEVRNMSQFVLLEDRAFGNTGRFDVWYDKSTGDYLEPTREFGR